MSTEGLGELLLALGDDELVIGHRHSEWTGFAPHLEEDVAFSSIAQEEIGHAAAFYGILAGLTGGDPDGIALGRPPGDYRNATICERANRDWAYTLARHWLYDRADDLRLDALGATRHEELRALVTKVRREERYHLMHADTWVRRISSGPLEGRVKLLDALAEAYPEALGMFEPIEHEDGALEQGWLPTPSGDLRKRFVESIAIALDELGIPIELHERLDDSAEFVASSSGDLIAGGPAPAAGEPSEAGLGGRRGRHSEDFTSLWEDMTSTYRSDPGATW
jgi:ring-1,2-phenylacetyl-CoA epoxidase subunit PaaC